MRNNSFVIDANTVISAFIFKFSKPREAFERAIKTGEVFTSIETFEELSEVLLRKKFDKFISSEGKLLALKQYKELAVFRKVSETIRECRDPKDDKYLELAVSVNASCIITGDKDLLILHPCLPDRQAFRGIPVLNAADFLNNF